MAQSQVRIAWELLSKFVTEVFVRAGVPPEDAETQAAVLLWANLRGVDSHGVQFVPRYVESIDTGQIKVKPNIQIERETPATLLIDADYALGPVVTVFALNRVMEKAKEVGIGWAFIRNTNHQGAMGYYPQIAAEKDMVGIAWVCSEPNMTPYGAKTAGIANNPIAIAVPAKRHRPLVLDMATSIAAGGKLLTAREKGISIPEGWALDEDGNPTTDPWQVGALLPVGGPKGSGLALMLECLTSVMLDTPKLEPTLQSKAKRIKVGDMPNKKSPVRRDIQNSVVAVIDISTFTDVEEYKEHIDNLIDGLKALPEAEGFSEIFVPGEPEERAFDDRSRNGIPIPEKTFRTLQSIAERFNIELPVGL